MKNLSLIFLLLLLPIILIGQKLDSLRILNSDTLKKTYWIYSGTTGLNVSQTTLSNWAAGGQSSVSGTARINLSANKKKNKHTWDNSIDLAYGLVQQAKDPLIKSEDRIEINSKFSEEAYKNWSYSILLNFRTQFDKGYQKPDRKVTISDFMAPAFLVYAIGMNYKPNNYFSFFISPFTGKTTFVLNQNLANVGAFGVEHGKNIRNEFGSYFKTEFKKDVFENVNLINRLALFSNYSNNPSNIDVNWEVIVSLKVNKFISTTIMSQLLYDDDVIQKTQFKEVIAVGITYKFSTDKSPPPKK